MAGLLQEQSQENNQMHHYLYRMGKPNPGCLLRWQIEVCGLGKPGPDSQTGVSLSTESHCRASCGTGVWEGGREGQLGGGGILAVGIRIGPLQTHKL